MGNTVYLNINRSIISKLPNKDVDILYKFLYSSMEDVISLKLSKRNMEILFNDIFKPRGYDLVDISNDKTGIVRYKIDKKFYYPSLPKNAQIY